jgi:Domain of unknown function (DUF6438)
LSSCLSVGIKLFIFVLLGIACTSRSHQLGTNVAPSAESINEVQLERTVCFGSCPAYKVSLRRDETSTYVGEAHVSRLGTYQGQVDRYSFDRLAKLIEAHGFFNMKDRYPDDGTVIVDAPNSIVKVAHGGKEKAIFDNGLNEPIELKKIEEAIDEVVDQMEWKKVE